MASISRSCTRLSVSAYSSETLPAFFAPPLTAFKGRCFAAAAACAFAPASALFAAAGGGAMRIGDGFGDGCVEATAALRMGAGAGSGVTAAWATHRKWAIALPASTLASGLAAAIAVGAVAGLYPALRAAFLSPTEALRS